MFSQFHIRICKQICQIRTESRHYRRPTSKLQFKLFNALVQVAYTNGMPNRPSNTHRRYTSRVYRSCRLAMHRFNTNTLGMNIYFVNKKLARERAL